MVCSISQIKTLGLSRQRLPDFVVATVAVPPVAATEIVAVVAEVRERYD